MGRDHEKLFLFTSTLMKLYIYIYKCGRAYICVRVVCRFSYIFLYIVNFSALQNLINPENICKSTC
jgi:hypothetical protein